jgi:hypothetical protein
MMMRRRSIVIFGCLVSGGTIGLANPAIAQPPVPVVRANGFTKQVPSCYIETTNSGFQNLDANCLMGKVPEPPMFDMVTDRDGDGVPDDLVPLLKQMNAAIRVPSDTPEGLALQGKQLQQSFQMMAKRAPVTAATRQNLRELSNVLGTMGRITSDNPQFSQQYEQLMALSSQLNQDPVVRQFETYSNRYNANQAKRK